MITIFQRANVLYGMLVYSRHHSCRPHVTETAFIPRTTLLRLHVFVHTSHASGIDVYGSGHNLVLCYFVPIYIYVPL